MRCDGQSPGKLSKDLARSQQKGLQSQAVYQQRVFHKVRATDGVLLEADKIYKTRPLWLEYDRWTSDCRSRLQLCDHSPRHMHAIITCFVWAHQHSRPCPFTCHLKDEVQCNTHSSKSYMSLGEISSTMTISLPVLGKMTGSWSRSFSHTPSGQRSTTEFDSLSHK